MFVFGAQSAEDGRSTSPECSVHFTEFQRDRAEGSRSLAAGNVLDALHQLGKAYALCPADYDTAHDLAVAEIMAGETHKAETVIGMLLQKEDRAELHGLLGEAESREQHYKAAAEEYQIAAEMDPSEANIFDFGTSLFRLSEDAAEKILRYGVDKYTTSIRLRVALGTVLYAQGRSEEAARLLCEAEKLDPSDPRPLEFLADNHNVPLAMLPDVSDMFTHLRQEYPNDGLLLFDDTMVKSRRWSGDRDAVPENFVASLKTALALNPRISDAHFELSLIYKSQGRYADEISELRKAIAIAPNNEEYHYHLAFAFRHSGDKDGYRREIGQFQELHDRGLRAIGLSH